MMIHEEKQYKTLNWITLLGMCNCHDLQSSWIIMDEKYLENGLWIKRSKMTKYSSFSRKRRKGIKETTVKLEKLEKVLEQLVNVLEHIFDKALKQTVNQYICERKKAVIRTMIGCSRLCHVRLTISRERMTSLMEQSNIMLQF